MFADTLIDSNWAQMSRRGWTTIASFALQAAALAMQWQGHSHSRQEVLCPSPRVEHSFGSDQKQSLRRRKSPPAGPHSRAI